MLVEVSCYRLALFSLIFSTFLCLFLILRNNFAEILAILYGAVMNITPENAEAQERDRFILSKGHSSAPAQGTAFSVIPPQHYLGAEHVIIM